MGVRIRETYQLILIGLVAAAPGQAAWSDSAGGSHLAVTAQVAAVTRIEGVQRPVTVTIGPNDAARGYVTAQATVRVRSNAPGGYVLTLWPRAPWFDSVRVVGAGPATQLSGDGGSIAQPAPGSAVDDVSLELTFSLHEGLAEGAYAWPIEFAVSPL